MSTTTFVCRDSSTRDEEFYFEDGSCVIQVRDRLFNLHRSILSVNSGFFRQMFSLPQPANDQSGRSDEHPIRCDDSVDDFRALCHILYRNLAEPGPEPESPNVPAMLRMTRIASLAHKYEFSGIQEWAHKSISGPLLATNGLPLDDVLFVLEVALECSWDEISANLKMRLQDYISNDTNRTSLETASRLSLVLNFAERHKCISLQAAAYNLYLQSIEWSFTSVERKETRFPVQPAVEIPTSFRSLSALNDAQKLCLFRGAAQMSSLKAHLRIPPPFSHNNTGCITQGLKDYCEKAILKKWEQIFLLIAPRVGPLEILRLGSGVLKELKPPESSLECVQALIHELDVLTQKLDLVLPEYFGLKNPEKT